MGTPTRQNHTITKTPPAKTMGNWLNPRASTKNEITS